MQPRQYVDLDLLIETQGNGYVARVIDSPVGQASHPFELPFTEVGLENFILKLGHSRSVTRKAHSSRRDTARLFGDELYRTVFGGEVGISFRRSLDEALQTQRGLRIRLRVDGAPKLAEIPWEYLYSQGLDRFLVMSKDTPLVRFLDLPAGSAPLTVDAPLRVLVMVSSPSDLERLDVEREVEQLRQATADLTATGALELELTPRADLRSLQRQLRRSQFHVFHFIGHGVYDAKQDDGLLMLEDEHGRSHPVSGLELGVLLHDHHSLRLAVLNACEGARGSVENPLGGVAQTLIRQGLPAAVAMQFEISDEAALVFAHEFYLAIADGYPIEAAATEARKAIFASGNDVEWGTPVLHLRARDGRVFNLQPRPDTELRLGSLREAATLASAERRFADAATTWEQIAGDSPDDEAAALMLERARHGVEAVALYAEAAGMLADGRHRDAIAALDRIEALDPDHGDPNQIGVKATAAIAVEEAERRELVERESRGAAAAEEEEELARAREAISAGELGDAQRRIEAVMLATPDHPGALELRELVKRRFRAVTLMEEAASAYGGQRWEDVVALVDEARTLDPDLEDVGGLGGSASWQLRQHEEAAAKKRELVERESRAAAAEEELVRAREALSEGELSDARRRIDSVLVATPDHPDARELREVVKRRLRARDSMEEAAAASEEERWEDVVALVEQARTLDPDLEDEQGLAAGATWQLLAQQRAAAPAGPPPSVEPPAQVEHAPAPKARRRSPSRVVIAAAAAVAVVVAVMLAMAGDPDPGDDPGDPDLGAADPDAPAPPPVELPAGTVGVIPVSGISIDGNPGDWPDAEVINSDATVFPVGAAPGATARWHLGWDFDALYLVVEVTDPSIDRAPLDQPDQLFRGDSVHFEFGPDPAGAGSLRSGDLHVMLAPVDPSRSEVLPAINPAIDGAFRVAPGGSAQPGIEAATIFTSGGYLVEAAIPWSILGVGSPQSGLVFGLNLNASDGDGSGGLNTMVSNNPNRTGENQATPATWKSGMLLDG